MKTFPAKIITIKALLAAITALTLMALSGCTAAPQQAETPTQQETNSITQETTMTEQNSYQQTPPAAGDTVVTIETDMGTIKARLFPEETPETVKNMEELAKAGHYTNVPFHRIGKGERGENFVIQTGDFTNGNGTGGYSYKGAGTTIKTEVSPKLRHLYGALGMARTAKPDSNGSQFYFVTNKNGASFLDGSYTVFGQVYEGFEVLEKIAAVETEPHSDEPLTPILMKSVTVEKL